MFSADVKRALLERCLRGELGLDTAQKIPARNPDEPVPLSYSQEQVWMHAQLVPDVPLYNEPVTIHYSGVLDPAALEQAFNEIFRRHEAWRTGFRIVDGHPVAVTVPELSITLPVVDLRDLSEQRREIAAVIIATEEARKPIDLGQPPLFRANLIRLADEHYRLYLSLSHIIFDGVAIYRVFLPELAALYTAQVAVALARAGRKGEALRIAHELETISRKRYVSPYGLAQIYAALNSNEDTFKWLQAAYDDRAVWMGYLAVDPIFDRYRSDQRFRELLQRIDLP